MAPRRPAPAATRLGPILCGIRSDRSSRQTASSSSTWWTAARSASECTWLPTTDRPTGFTSPGAGVNDTRSWPGRTDVSWQPIYDSEPPTGAVLPARDLAVGQCFNTPGMGRVGNLTDAELEEVSVVDCSEPHFSEVIGVVQIPAPPDADFSASDDYSGDLHSGVRDRLGGVPRRPPLQAYPGRLCT